MEGLSGAGRRTVRKFLLAELKADTLGIWIYLDVCGVHSLELTWLRGCHGPLEDHEIHNKQVVNTTSPEFQGEYYLGPVPVYLWGPYQGTYGIAIGFFNLCWSLSDAPKFRTPPGPAATRQLPGPRSVQREGLSVKGAPMRRRSGSFRAG